MAAGTGCDSDQTIGTFFDGLFSKPIANDVVQHNAAPTMNAIIDSHLCA